MSVAALIRRMVESFNRHEPAAMATSYATGRSIDLNGTVPVEIVDGRVTAERHYWPFGDTLVQLGLLGSVPALSS